MQKKILFIGHDANFAGAQLVLLHFLKYLKSKNNIETLLLLGEGGGLLNQFQEASKTIIWNRNKIEITSKIAKLKSIDFKIEYIELKIKFIKQQIY